MKATKLTCECWAAFRLVFLDRVHVAQVVRSKVQLSGAVLWPCEQRLVLLSRPCSIVGRKTVVVDEGNKRLFCALLYERPITSLLSYVEG